MEHQPDASLDYLISRLSWHLDSEGASGGPQDYTEQTCVHYALARAVPAPVKAAPRA